MQGINGFTYLERGLLTRSKDTVADVKDDAVDMLHSVELPEGSRTISVGAFIWGLEGRGATVSAAQDTLRFLGGTGLLPDMPDGSIDVVAFRERYAAQQETAS